MIDSVSAVHTAFMAQAVRLAQRGRYTTKSNPRVGCVLVKNQQVIGEGWHEFAGQAHAEVNALNSFVDEISASGSTAYVTLEPCSHHGKTGPCCDALIKAGVSQVVFGMQDPNPEVSGQGLDKLRQAGIAVIGPVLEAECRKLNPGFIKRMQSGLPWLRCKLAMSLDGRTAMASGESQWITGNDAREDVQKIRAQSCAIITGSGTVKQDNPALTVRSQQLPESARQFQPLRVVLSRTEKQESDDFIDADIFQPFSETLLFNEPDPEQVLRQLAAKQCNEVLLESGSTLAGAFMAAGLIDELIIYMAPCLMGSQAMPLLTLPLDNMQQKVELVIDDIRAVGSDWRISARPVQK